MRVSLLSSPGLTLAVLCALPLAACGGGGSDRQRPPARPSAARPAVSAVSAAEYMSTAASLDMFEIRSSELALTRARSARLREFASMMISAHRGTAAQLSFAGRRLNLLPAAGMLLQHQAMLQELERAGDFDAVYRRQQIAAHEAALRLHSIYAARGASATLRPVAANAAPIVRRHLDMLRRM